eukprot:scaffold20146_cov19-Tisochrysis_lutea.AAC.3
MKITNQAAAVDCCAGYCCGPLYRLLLRITVQAIAADHCTGCCCGPLLLLRAIVQAAATSNCTGMLQAADSRRGAGGMRHIHYTYGTRCTTPTSFVTLTKTVVDAPEFGEACPPH